MSDSLKQIAARIGLHTQYTDAFGGRQDASVHSLRSLLISMGFKGLHDPSRDSDIFERTSNEYNAHLLETTYVCTSNDARVARAVIRLRIPVEGHGEWRLEGEGIVRTGKTVALDGAQSDLGSIDVGEIPLGIYRLQVTHNGLSAVSVVVCAPSQAYVESSDHKAACIAAPLWSMRCGSDYGSGHLGNLAALGTQASELGAGVVGTLPVTSNFLSPEDWDAGRADPCPYLPVSRQHLNELYIDPATVRRLFPDCFLSGDCVTSHMTGKQSHVDWQAVSKRVHGVLDTCTRSCITGDTASHRGFEDWLTQFPSAQNYGHFRASLDGLGRQVAHRHVVGQYLAWESLQRTREMLHASNQRLYLDLPIGMHPLGYEAQENQSLHIPGATIGAPPDSAFRNGQNWSSPAPLPLWVPSFCELDQPDAFEHLSAFRDLVSATMSMCDILRIDHVLGLQRVWVIPEGSSPTDGAYLTRPLEALAAVLRLESIRHRCRLVGEDLGTVDQSVRDEMDNSRISKLCVGLMTIESEDGANPAAHCVASIGTHDFPPWEAYWACSDLEERKAFGLIDDGGVDWERGARKAALERIGDNADSGFAHVSQQLARDWGSGGAWMVVLWAADLIGDEHLINMPGTVSPDHWGAILSLPIDSLSQSAKVRRRVQLAVADQGSE